MASHVNSSNSASRPRRPQYEVGRYHSTAKPLASKAVTEDQQTEATRASSSAIVPQSTSKRPSFKASSQRVPLIIPHEIERLPAYVCISPRTPIPPSPSRTSPPTMPPALPINYFDCHTHHMHLPYPIVAVPDVDEETNTIYFTPGAVVSANVVYVSVRRHRTLDVDLLCIFAENNPRPLTQRAHEIGTAMNRVMIGRVLWHVHRQHRFIISARCFSRDFVDYPYHTFMEYPDARPTDLIPDVPYFEYYLERVALPKFWRCNDGDMARIFDPPDLKLHLLA